MELKRCKGDLSLNQLMKKREEKHKGEKDQMNLENINLEHLNYKIKDMRKLLEIMQVKMLWKELIQKMKVIYCKMKKNGKRLILKKMMKMDSYSKINTNDSVFISNPGHCRVIILMKFVYLYYLLDSLISV